MSNGHDIPDLERITFFSGQRLTARDLSELQEVQRERAWLHNRSLHGWGIGIGLAVTGESGASMVEVGEGYAVDCMGREIILTEPKTRTVPAVAGTPSGGEAEYYLVAGYQDNADQAVAENRPGVCVPAGTVRLTEEPRLAWQQPDQLEEGLDVILAKAWVKNCQLSRPLSLLERRSARPSQYPYIAANQTTAGSTEWESWVVGGNVGVLTRVDTSTARFQATPWYMAHVIGERFFGSDIGSPLMVSQDAVTEATPAGFTFRVHFGSSFANGMTGNLVSRLSSGDLAWYVAWMGFEA